MNIWIQIKGQGIQDKEILILQDGSFYSKSNIILSSITSSQSDIKELCCNILSGTKISDASIVESKKISFIPKQSIVNFLNKILFLFVKPETRIDVMVVKRKDNSLNVTFTKGKDSYSFTYNNRKGGGTSNQDEATPNNSMKEQTKTPKSVFIENIDFFKELLEPLYSDHEKRDFYIEKWKHTMTLFPDGTFLQKEFEVFETDIDLWFNTLFSWGIKRDKCKEYNKGSFNAEFYDIDLSNDRADSSIYKVIIPCWSYIMNFGNGNKEIVIKKGVLRNECL